MILNFNIDYQCPIIIVKNLELRETALQGCCLTLSPGDYKYICIRPSHLD